MPSEVTICNRALSAIASRESIASLTEASTAARQCNLIYADTRDEVLQMAFWNFAKKTGYPALYKQAPGTPGGVTGATQWTTAFPAPPWLYEYAVPQDCLQVQTVLQLPTNAYVGVPFTSNGQMSYPYLLGPGAMFEVASDLDAGGNPSNYILTNQFQAIARYTARVTQPALFSATFIEALVQALAAKLALALTGKVSIANTKFQQANAVIIQARASDANEGLTVIDNVPDWLAIRDDYGYDQCIGYTAPYGPLFAIL